MRLETSQRMRLEQRMKLAPHMIQSMEILCLPLLALQERIEQELISNPVLEMQEDRPEESAEEPPQEAAGDDDLRHRDLVVSNDRDKVADFQRMVDIADDDDFDDYYASARGGSFRSVGEDGRDRKLDAMANTAARDMSLHEYLTFQWNLIEADPEVKRGGQLIINQLEEDGYLRTSLDDLAHRGREAVSLEHLNRALVLVQHLEPPGVAARDVQECLLLQLDTVVDPPPIHELSRRLAEDHLGDLEANRIPAIARGLNVSLDRVRDAAKYLQRFDPHPGDRMLHDKVPYVVPDVIIDYSPTGDGYVVRLASGNEPVLYINSVYRRMLRNSKVDTGTRDFLKRNIQSARWLIESIEQRRSTLLRVADAVAKAQREFLDHGPKALRPLPMATVAQQVGVHVATVSRAVADKYVQCPRGIYPLRQFFSGGQETEGGESISWSAVKAKIKEVLEHEDAANPLSDDEIVDRMKAEGINVARRTVAKYRKILSIPSARQRKKF